ncbi:kinase-like protein [Pseudovirgaria hyperparasitica]|uniref:non-specific serine/threonine protein kinase n=1 Tax=Pseudovirgaria hyperparasitica TaxID=470096 RepID=A0A6A6VWD6_9PEZI|nr:kinase-like protein [Pseudovirgaria hyperparasitica]KAF2753551.1 kinase-like protein [Pseudovirgaria hyperparasitica]
MAFLVSFDDSDSDSTPDEHIPPNSTSNPSDSMSPQSNLVHRQSRPLPLQVSQPVPSPKTAALDTPPTTPLSDSMRTVSIPETSRASSDMSRRSVDFTMNDSRHSPLQFDFSATDYTVSTTKVLGEGLWSNVYLAQPTPARSKSSREVLTPPLTPIKSRSRPDPNVTSVPTAYAIKTPTSRSARNVLTAEARVLSYVTAIPEVSSFVVPFYGQDTRNGALVLAAMPETLEMFIDSKLNRLSESDRSKYLAMIFPSFALRMVKGMESLHSVGVVHADLKPSNILLQTNTHGPPKPFYADFSSSVPPPHLQIVNEKTATSLGGGTWDFLSPILLKEDINPTPRTDIHALVISFLFLIFGASPFDSVGSNVFLRREMVKQNQAINAGLNSTQNFRRLQSLQKSFDWDVTCWLEKGLGTKDINLKAWTEELENRLCR